MRFINTNSRFLILDSRWGKFRVAFSKKKKILLEKKLKYINLIVRFRIIFSSFFKKMRLRKHLIVKLENLRVRINYLR